MHRRMLFLQRHRFSTWIIIIIQNLHSWYNLCDKTDVCKENQTSRIFIAIGSDLSIWSLNKFTYYNISFL
jgi:hypothetical protein